MQHKNKREFGFAIGRSPSIRKPYLFHGDLQDCIKKANKYGYSVVEPHIRYASDIDLDSTLKYMEKYDIGISGISTGLAYNLDKLSLIDTDKNKKNEAIKRLKEFIDLSSKLDCAVIIGTMRGNIPDHSKYKECCKSLAESVKELTDLSLKKGVMILIEVANRYESNYLNRVEEIHELIVSNNIDGVKILMDTFHMNIEEKVIEKTIRDYGDLLGYFHVADSNRHYPGAGHLDLRKIAQVLDDIAYKGNVVLECLPLPTGEEAALKAIEFLNKNY